MQTAVNECAYPRFITAVFINPITVNYFFLSTWLAANVISSDTTFTAPIK